VEYQQNNTVVFRSNHTQTCLQGNSPQHRIQGSLQTGVPAVTSQQSHLNEGQEMASLQSMQEHFKPVPESTSVMVQSELEFEFRSWSSSVKGQIEGTLNSSRLVEVLEASQPSHLVGPGRRAGPVGPRGIQVNCQC
jgi:hypothetical protein